MVARTARDAPADPDLNDNEAEAARRRSARRFLKANTEFKKALLTFQHNRSKAVGDQETPRGGRVAAAQGAVDRPGLTNQQRIRDAAEEQAYQMGRIANLLAAVSLAALRR